MQILRIVSGLMAGALAALLSAYAGAQTPDHLADCSQTRDLDRAIVGCSAALGAGSNDAQVRVNRGFAYFLRKDYAAAAADLDEAIRLAPKDPSAFARRGIVFRATGDDDLAIADFTRALDLGSSDLSVYVDRGMTHVAKGENALAITDFTTAIERDADKTFVGQLARIGRGLTLIYSGAPGKAQTDLRRATELNPKDPFFALFLQVAEGRAGSAGSLAAAVPNLDMAKWPAPVIRMFLGEGTAEAVLAVKGGEVTTCEADYFTAEFLALQGKREEAVRLYRKAQTDCPRYILERVAAGAALRSLGEKP